MIILTFFLWSGVTPLDITTAFNYESPFNENATTIYLAESNKQILNDRFYADSTEFIYCLYGKSYDNGYYIQRLEATKFIEYSENSVKYEKCKKTSSYLGTIHNHPNGSCRLSDVDKDTFIGDGSVIAGVICGNDKFGFYNYDNTEKALKVALVGGK